MQRNAYGPSEAERITRAFRGGHAAAHRAANAFIGGMMRHAPHDIETDLKGAFGSHSSDNIGVSPHPHSGRRYSHSHKKDTVADAPESTQGLSNSCAEPEQNATVHQDEEDEWISEQSSPEEAPAVEREHQHAAQTTSGRSGKKRRTDRQRLSAHNHHHSRVSHAPINASNSTESITTPTAAPSTLTPDVSGSPVLVPETSSSPTDVADEEPRGRAPPGSVLSPYAARRRPRNMRVVSLRGSETGSREVSPARSIRWADASAGASSATVRWPQSPSAQGSRAPSPGPPTPGEPVENDSG